VVAVGGGSGWWQWVVAVGGWEEGWWREGWWREGGMVEGGVVEGGRWVVGGWVVGGRGWVREGTQASRKRR
jgi:hypothetical protein